MAMLNNQRVLGFDHQQMDLLDLMGTIKKYGKIIGKIMGYNTIH